MKHAYLITAHNNFSVLKYALSMIDDPRNVVLNTCIIECFWFL